MMDTATLDKQTGDKVSFISFVISQFAEAYKMNVRDACLYLKKYGGPDCLLENWRALHTDNIIWAVYDIYDVCRINGGMR
jgi:hypothetical protein